MLENATGETSRDGSEALLLQPILFGDLELRNRVVMAPLTRMRAPTLGAAVSSIYGPSADITA